MVTDPISGQTAAPTPRHHWSSSSSGCKAKTADATTSYKHLQAQLNRIAAVRRLSPVRVTGTIKSDTVELVNRVFGTAYHHCDQVAENGFLPTAARKFADNIGAPAKGPKPKGIDSSLVIAAVGLLAAWQLGWLK